MKSLVKICHFPHGIAIANDFAKASVNGIIDNIQFPLFLASLRAQCERNLNQMKTQLFHVKAACPSPVGSLLSCVHDNDLIGLLQVIFLKIAIQKCIVCKKIYFFLVAFTFAFVLSGNLANNNRPL